MLSKYSWTEHYSTQITDFEILWRKRVRNRTGGSNWYIIGSYPTIKFELVLELKNIISNHWESFLILITDCICIISFFCWDIKRIRKMVQKNHFDRYKNCSYLEWPKSFALQLGIRSIVLVIVSNICSFWGYFWPIVGENSFISRFDGE